MSETSETHRGVTRGGKAIHFEWIHQDDQLRITTQKGWKHAYPVDEICRIIDWLAARFDDGWFPLANNVLKLHNGTEVDGLGVAVIRQRPGDVTHAQGSGYLGVALEHVGILEWNGKPKGIEWRIVQRPRNIDDLKRRLVNARMEYRDTGTSVMNRWIQLDDTMTIRLHNVIQMGLGFSAMTRLLETGSKAKLKTKIIDQLDYVFAATSEGEFIQVHSSFCRWGTASISLAEKMRDGMVVKESGPASYGQVAKILDVTLKVVVYYCHFPDCSRSEQLSKWLNAAVDTRMMAKLRECYPGDLQPWPKIIEQVDQNNYAAIQKVVRRFIADKHGGAITPVQFDDMYWGILNK